MDFPAQATFAPQVTRLAPIWPLTPFSKCTSAETISSLSTVLVCPFIAGHLRALHAQSHNHRRHRKWLIRSRNAPQKSHVSTSPFAPVPDCHVTSAMTRAGFHQLHYPHHTGKKSRYAADGALLDQAARMGDSRVFGIVIADDGLA